ncbi:MAG: hypothetical protein ABL903_08835 [Methylococcales bacterium]
MKKIIIAIALISALPLIANAEQKADASSKAAPKEHHMQNANPSSEAVEQVKEQAPEHVMNNANPSAKPAAEKAPAHTMKNN